MTETIQCEVLRSPRRYGVGFCLLLVSVLLVLPACSRGGYSNENDKLRAERLELKQEIEALQGKLAIRENELRATRQQLDEGSEPIDGVEPPRLAGIVLGMYSGPIDLDGDKVYDALRVYVRPVDQHGRQMTAQGKARVRLIVTPDEGEPKAVLDQAYDVKAFHEAYRSGVTGTHYTLGADLPKQLPDKATLHVTLIDAATGRGFTAEKPVVLMRAPVPTVSQ